MKLRQAIEIKSRTGEQLLNTDPDDIDEADRLSLEAGKLVQRFRDNGPYPFVLALPGETPESASERLISTRIASP